MSPMRLTKRSPSKCTTRWYSCKPPTPSFTKPSAKYAAHHQPTGYYTPNTQGRFSFYMTSNGEEATTVGSAAALSLDDTVFTQYREQGVFLFRGFTLQQMADQV